MEKCYQTNLKKDTYRKFFDSGIPELVEAFKGFVVQVNDYLTAQQNDTRYHKSQTHGKSKHRHITIDDEEWRFSGELFRENQPFTDKAVFYYRGLEMWLMTRKSQFDPKAHDCKDSILACLWRAAEKYNPDRPWCGPQDFYDEETRLHYEAVYSGTDDDFVIQEAIWRDSRKNVLWSATCEGGYTK